MTLKVLSIFGTRPEAIKMAPVVRELQNRPEIDSYVCVTAQHREMLDQVLDLFHLTPDYDLNLMRPGQTLTGLAARVMVELDSLLRHLQPDWVLVQGDTTTVMASALAARHLKIRVGHVEAGLRTGDMLNPFPEEMNRVVTDAISDLHFAPTPLARDNLRRAGIPDASITITGNTVIDALLEIAGRPWSPGEDHPLYRWSNGSAPPRRLIMVTAHRRENFGRPLENICAALREIAERGRDDLHLIYPVHLNPNVQEPVYRLLGDVPNISLLPPLDYLSLVQLMKRSTLILTDSGGIQEEAPGLGVPVLVLRRVTERQEGVEAGTVRLVGTDTETIVAETFRLLTNPAAYRAMAQAVNPYGDGHAARRIVDRLLQEVAVAG
ncbi:MAG: UDP-N-acetylglucosamine 2-epimerase (non-hydrolyzing) [Chloroflexi bacterium]|nr:MAG: UDP-N-acetylglucosamine 2-epimerase (non-hydrolyzing) [Chloroflexota bacterium]